MSRVPQPAPAVEEKIHVELGGPDTDELRPVAGSNKDTLNLALIRQAVAAQWTPRNATHEQQGAVALATTLAMMELAPRDGVEGMLAAQFVAMHGMTMELARKAMLPDQPHEIATGMRKAAVQASRACAELLDALDRRRGKRGRQNIKVTHLHISGDARAVIGNFSAVAGGGGDGNDIDAEPHAGGHLAGQLGAGAFVPEMRGANPERQPVPVPRSARKTTVPDARRTIDGAAHG